MKKVQARRQRIPAFGEWNYDYGGAGDWPVTQYFDSAMQAGLVVTIPPSPKPAKKAVKWSGSATLEAEDEKQRQAVVVGLGEQGAVKIQGKQSRVADAGAHASPAYKACRLAVKAVDQDLYQIPPDMLCHEPRKRLTRRSVWMGCLGLSCVA
ncbi:hypothetical protein SEVIR_5G332800v4 [Setaria viridis]|uniref:RIN4 pathogenic type III effector avirulence factor Avr cleavage site domain-containing protein n=1 Tax=Setaria viridis TaxID=4556 RepID=A0A4U6UL17_SETVI|nr:uncharacterized protein LOC117855561 [Setaria viridis]TKW16950.1 hypothetical protein SEVIR_5G332800v2 [Setaria viridis]